MTSKSNRKSANDNRRSVHRLLPVPASQSARNYRDDSWADVENGMGSDLPFCRTRLFHSAPFIAQLAGQSESPADARSRRRERRETAADSYAQSCRPDRPSPRLKVVV